MAVRGRFTEADITRAMRGARKSGFSRVRVGIDLFGNLVVDASDDPAAIAPERRNPLDRLLPVP